MLDEDLDGALSRLSGTVDVERPHRHDRESELPVVGVAEVLAGEFADGVCPARLARAARHGVAVLGRFERHGSEDLGSRKVDHAVLHAGEASGLENIRRAYHVDPHRSRRALDDRVDAGNRCRVNDNVRASHAILKPLAVEHVAPDDRQVHVPAVARARERVAVEVVVDDDLVLLDQPGDKAARDEARAARHEDRLSLDGVGQWFTLVLLTSSAQLAGTDPKPTGIRDGHSHRTMSTGSPRAVPCRPSPR